MAKEISSSVAGIPILVLLSLLKIHRDNRREDHRSCMTDAKPEDVARTKPATALEDDFDSGNQEEAETVDTSSENRRPRSSSLHFGLTTPLPELG
jgi:hypothetical protein